MITPIQIDPQPTPEMEVRILTAEEIQKYVAPEYAKTGNTLPDPSISKFVGVVAKGEVILFLGLQLKLHAQPLWIKPGEAQHLPSLIKAAEDTILSSCGPQWVYLFSPAGRMAQIAQHMGMGLEPWVILSKLVTYPVPSKLDVDLMPVEDTHSEEAIQ